MNSEIITAVLADTPSKPASPTEVTDETTESSFKVLLTKPSNGGSPITQYEVQIDNGVNGGTFYTVDWTLNLFSVITSGIVRGWNYGVWYRAWNVNGWGDYSDITYVLAASWP